MQLIVPTERRRTDNRWPEGSREKMVIFLSGSWSVGMLLPVVLVRMFPGFKEGMVRGASLVAGAQRSLEILRR